ncbi:MULTISPECIES: hypothetical protein [unclassified Mesorhizobium]|uniref:hypothetical protein n=1 Tax=unclassified Mesorhizobium TaxID=325217 RepID=UPI001091B9CC|nr:MULTISPECIES: hypothetical protein [unclassified Mesorhizobium]TGQ43696.1 hypothetical protein EN857_06290 [Mesorhizobium sp. M4B.F.Ca.ET.214.01.1.1]TGQ62511.1 hypothetical protein EN854_06295 [Mesorhizobium sp. M4B.F.Ca.ET.211.01.1.1]TGU39713.1 hypothetical protein EN793_06290 [Mesorhizobium sp. M4B.F.Ca.ET.150.01.1.1]TIX17087.1 MAG: hypothetical protein E5V46_00355 [Mesorhizobium sp.]
MALFGPQYKGVFGQGFDHERSDFVPSVLSGRVTTLEFLATAIQPRIAIPSDNHARISAFFRSGPHNIYPVDKTVGLFCAQVLDEHLPIQCALNRLEVAVYVAIVGLDKIAFFAAKPLPIRKCSTPKRRVVYAPPAVVLHPSDIAEQNWHLSVSAEGTSYRLRFRSGIPSPNSDRRLKRSNEQIE